MISNITLNSTVQLLAISDLLLIDLIPLDLFRISLKTYTLENSTYVNHETIQHLIRIPEYINSDLIYYISNKKQPTIGSPDFYTYNKNLDVVDAIQLKYRSNSKTMSYQKLNYFFETYNAKCTKLEIDFINENTFNKQKLNYCDSITSFIEKKMISESYNDFIHQNINTYKKYNDYVAWISNKKW